MASAGSRVPCLKPTAAGQWFCSFHAGLLGPWGKAARGGSPEIGLHLNYQEKCRVNDPDPIKRIVERARQQAASQERARQTEDATDLARTKSRIASAARLQRELPGKLAAVCMHSSGAMQWGSETVNGSGTEFKLSWIDPAPERLVSIVVENTGIVLWGWFAEWMKPSYIRMEAAGLTDAFLLSLVEALGDQAAWEDKRLPELNLHHQNP